MNKKTVKKILTEKTLKHLEGCVNDLDYNVNKIKRMGEEKYDELSAGKENIIYQFGCNM